MPLQVVKPTAAFDGLRSHAPLYIPDDASGTLVYTRRRVRLVLLATFVLPTRPTEHWVQSVRRFHGMLERIAKCALPTMELPVRGSELDLPGDAWKLEHHLAAAAGRL